MKMFLLCLDAVEKEILKRPFDGKIANLNCKKIYVTDDNPRSENPKNIRRQILKRYK